MERTFGWRHFRASQKRKQAGDVFVLMVSTCDEATQFWVRAAGQVQLQAGGPGGRRC